MEDDQPNNAWYNHCMVSDLCLRYHVELLQHTHVPRTQTVTPEGSAKHPSKVPQNPHHDNEIWKS